MERAFHCRHVLRAVKKSSQNLRGKTCQMCEVCLSDGFRWFKITQNKYFYIHSAPLKFCTSAPAVEPSLKLFKITQFSIPPNKLCSLVKLFYLTGGLKVKYLFLYLYITVACRFQWLLSVKITFWPPK